MVFIEHSTRMLSNDNEQKSESEWKKTNESAPHVWM